MKTQWFSADFRPVRKGLYERRLHATKGSPRERMSPWDGAQWEFYGRASIHQTAGFEWRGLAKKP